MAEKDGPGQVVPEQSTKAVDVSQWFVKSFKIPDPAQALLEQYSEIAPDDVVPHVTDLVSRNQLEIRSQN